MADVTRPDRERLRRLERVAREYGRGRDAADPIAGRQDAAEPPTPRRRS